MILLHSRSSTACNTKQEATHFNEYDKLDPNQSHQSHRLSTCVLLLFDSAGHSVIIPQNMRRELLIAAQLQKTDTSTMCIYLHLSF